MQAICKRLLPAVSVLAVAAAMLAGLAWLDSHYTAGLAETQNIADDESRLPAAARIESEPQLLGDTSYARPLEWAGGGSMPSVPIAVATGMDADETASDEDYVDFVDVRPVTRPAPEYSPPATLPVDMSAARPIAEANQEASAAAVPSMPQPPVNPFRPKNRRRARRLVGRSQSHPVGAVAALKRCGGC